MIVLEIASCLRCDCLVETLGIITEIHGMRVIVIFRLAVQTDDTCTTYPEATPVAKFASAKGILITPLRLSRCPTAYLRMTRHDSEYIVAHPPVDQGICSRKPLHDDRPILSLTFVERSTVWCVVPYVVLDLPNAVCPSLLEVCPRPHSLPGFVQSPGTYECPQGLDFIRSELRR